MRWVRVSSALFLSVCLSGGAMADEDKLFTSSEWSHSRFEAGDEVIESRRLLVTGAYDYGDVALSGTFATDFRRETGDELGSISFTGGASFDMTDRLEFGLSGGFYHSDLTNQLYVETSLTYAQDDHWVTGHLGANEDGDFLPETYLGVSGGHSLGAGTEVALSYYSALDESGEDVASLDLLHLSGPLRVTASALFRGSDARVTATTRYDVTRDLRVSLEFDYLDPSDGPSSEGVGIGGSVRISGGVFGFARFSRYSGGDLPETDGLTVGLLYETGTPTLRRATTLDRALVPTALDEAAFRF